MQSCISKISSIICIFRMCVDFYVNINVFHFNLFHFSFLFSFYVDFLFFFILIIFYCCIYFFILFLLLYLFFIIIVIILTSLFKHPVGLSAFPCQWLIVGHGRQCYCVRCFSYFFLFMFIVVQVIFYVVL